MADWLSALGARPAGELTCFVCPIVEASDDQRIQEIIDALEVRPEITGLCSPHASRLVELAGKEPRRATAVLEALARHAANRLAGRSTGHRRRQRVDWLTLLVPWIGPTHAPAPLAECDLCVELVRDERRVVSSLALALTDDRMRAQLEAVSLPCRTHLRQVLAGARPEVQSWARNWTLRELDQLTAQLNDYVWKCDWNRRDEPRGDEQLAPLRALQLLAGSSRVAAWRPRDPKV